MINNDILEIPWNISNIESGVYIARILVRNKNNFDEYKKKFFNEIYFNDGVVLKNNFYLFDMFKIVVNVKIDDKNL